MKLYFNECIQHLSLRLKESLPGEKAQWTMASSDRRVINFPRTKNAHSKLAGVLLLLYPVDNQPNIIFIQRPKYPGVHGGQVSFPGGKKEKQDASLAETALRETCEEIGLCKNEIHLLGTLTPLFIPVSNIEVTPFVGYCTEKPIFTPNRSEVVYTIEVLLSRFLDATVIKEEPMNIRNEEMLIKYFDMDGNVIWGATAMILHELLVMLP